MLLTDPEPNTPSELTGRASLAKKMARVMAKLERLPKNGFNTHFNYSFATSEDVFETIRKSLAEEGIAFFASLTHTELVSFMIVKNGQEKPVTKTQAHFDFTFVDTDTGAEKTCHWIGEAIDEQDKSVSKSATSAAKYFLLRTFVASTGDDPDPDASEGQTRSRKSAQSGSRPAQSSRQPSSAKTSSAASLAQPGAKPSSAEASSSAQPSSQPSSGSNGTSPIRPNSARDYETFHLKTAPFFKLSKKEAAEVLKEFDNDCIQAYDSLLAQNVSLTK